MEYGIGSAVGFVIHLCWMHRGWEHNGFVDSFGSRQDPLQRQFWYILYGAMHGLTMGTFNAGKIGDEASFLL